MAKKQRNAGKADGLVPSEITLEQVLASTTPEEILRDKLVKIAQEQIRTSMQYKDARMQEVQKSIDLYHGKTKKALKGRWNVPLPLMSGYIDSLISKQDDPPKVKFGHQDMADLQRAQKVQAKWEQDSSEVEGRWAEKDRMMKKLASFYGVAIPKYFAYNDSKGIYHSHLEVVDALDFECEPLGGQNLRNHKFKGQRNIFKTKAELETYATGDNPLYDKKQVLRLVMAYSPGADKTFDKLYQEKTDRLRSLGFDPDRNSYMGIEVYSLTEWYMEYEGTWYYLFFEPHSGICVRFAPLVEVFESGEDPFDAWHTHSDPFNFWSKAPADDMRPVAESMNIIFNQALDNREKKNYGQRAYDPTVFPDPSQLEWRPDGLVEVEAGITNTQSISAGIYEFTIPDLPEAGTIDLMKFMDDITGLKTGITPSAQGASDEKRVGIYYGNLQQVADRLGLYNKSYSESWGRVGRKYYLGLRQFVKSNKMMVRMIGTRGYNWQELVKDDVNPTQDFNIEIVGGQAMVQLDEMLKKTKTDSLIAITKLGRFNPDVVTEEILRNGGWEEGQIKRIMDMQSYGTDDMISIAEQAIQDIVYNNKQPKLYRKATYFFMQYILDKADEIFDHKDVTLQEYQTLLQYVAAHRDFAIYNSMKQVRMQEAMMGAMPGETSVPGAESGHTAGPGEATATGAVIPGSPTGRDMVATPEMPLNPIDMKARAGMPV